jgi:sigma-B regulation protein RsbU (phosphoserine phosphatase)
MKFRWKLLILLLVISIIPIVSLRTFGIQNVRLMAEALISQIKGKQINDARHRLQLVINEYSKVIRTSREQAEMALFYQTFEVRRILQTELSRYNQNKPSPMSDGSGTHSDEIIDHPSDAPVASGKNTDEMAIDAREPCFSVPSTVDAAYARSDILRLKRMTPMYQAVFLSISAI